MADEHPDLEAVGGAMREEWRAEQEAATRDAAEGFQHRQTLQDVLRDHMHRGDRLAVNVAGHRVAGVPEEIGADLLGLRTLFGRVDVHLAPGVPLWFEIYERAAAGGSRGVDVAGGSFVRALQLRESDEAATVGTVFDADGFDGKLRVGADWLTVIARAGAETTIPLSFVSWASALRT